MVLPGGRHPVEGVTDEAEDEGVVDDPDGRVGRTRIVEGRPGGQDRDQKGRVAATASGDSGNRSRTRLRTLARRPSRSGAAQILTAVPAVPAVPAVTAAGGRGTVAVGVGAVGGVAETKEV